MRRFKFIILISIFSMFYPAFGHTQDGIHSEDIRTTWFEKKYDRAIFEKLLEKKTVPDIISFLKEQNIHVLVIEHISQDHSGYRTVKVTPNSSLENTEVSEVVRDFATRLFPSGAKAVSYAQGFLLNGYIVAKDVILFDAYANDTDEEMTTLYHEAVHILFDREARRITNISDLQEISDRFNKEDHNQFPQLRRAFSSFALREKGWLERTSVYESDLDIFLRILDDELSSRLHEMDQLLQRHILEEATIEYLLLSAAFDQKSDLSKNNIHHMEQYSDSAIQEALKLCRKFKDETLIPLSITPLTYRPASFASHAYKSMNDGIMSLDTWIEKIEHFHTRLKDLRQYHLERALY